MKKPLLNFDRIKVENGYNYAIYNKKEEFLGLIHKKRVGRFMHWCFEPYKETYFSNGCLKEIVEFITKLYGKKNGTKEEQE